MFPADFSCLCVRLFCSFLFFRIPLNPRHEKRKEKKKDKKRKKEKKQNKKDDLRYKSIDVRDLPQGVVQAEAELRAGTQRHDEVRGRETR